MDEATNPTTPATEAALERRERLLQAILSLTEVLRADPEPVDAWSARLRDAAAMLAETIHEHVEEAETEDGFLDQVTQDAPGLAARVEALRAEHPVMRADARRMLETWPEDADPEALRAHVEPILSATRRHRERGTELLMDAYELDLSAGD
jgi:hypothetical protein